MSKTADGLRDTELLSLLIGLIYDCAIDPSNWERTLAEIRRSLGFCNGMFTVWTAPNGLPILNVTSGIADDYARRIPEHGADIVAQWGGAERIASFAVGEPKVLSREREQGIWADTPYYRDWIEPQGIIDLMAIPITRDRDTTCSVGFARHHSQGAIGEREVALARLLVPHIQRAVAISRILDVKTLAAANLVAALDAVAAGVVLVDRERGILCANKAARAMFTGGGPVIDQRGTLALGSAAGTTALRQAMSQAHGLGETPDRRGTDIPAIRPDGSPAVVHVLPLSQGALRPNLAPGASAAIFIAPATGLTQPSGETVAALFDLTPAETRVYLAISDGKTLAETAKALGISHATAKTHLLRLFAKTGTHRQAELVRLAGSFATPA
ncbi:MAG: helix-turn-helix transcriptional regulator [Mesorhizobium sp.]|uniref:helix-turn-helix transcriptional regulator n=1 Tax=Mesorhizobium sp. TaxID=1871066 RepID=UPI001AC26D92|nr:helix-turn-helix transcriptional regulator [Mesorhizobium sp.]MBN9221113.1 helix-turn-helix transcriptional regulator [Mesorhizobium sp.]